MSIPLAFMFSSKNKNDFISFEYFIKNNKHTPYEDYINGRLPRFIVAENNGIIYAIKWIKKSFDDFVDYDLQGFIQRLCRDKKAECSVEISTLEKTKEIYNLDNRIDECGYGKKYSSIQFDWEQ